jgi:hypothetical protein
MRLDLPLPIDHLLSITHMDMRLWHEPQCMAQ